MVVPDLSQDARFADNPLVTGPPHIRFYAGHPLATQDGHKVGAFCVIDSRPRNVTEFELQTLRDLAALVESELRYVRLSRTQADLIAALDAAQREAAVDSLTRLWNRETIFGILRRELARCKRHGLPLALVLADVDQFKSVNDSYGHVAGDAVLRAMAERMRSAVRPYDAVGRFGGEEFLLVLIECGPSASAQIAERVRLRIADAPVATPAATIAVTASLGVWADSRVADEDPERLVQGADRALYRAKAMGRNRVELGSA